MLNVTAVGTFNVANGLITGVLNDGSNEVTNPVYQLCDHQSTIGPSMVTASYVYESAVDAYGIMFTNWWEAWPGISYNVYSGQFGYPGSGAKGISAGFMCISAWPPLPPLP